MPILRLQITQGLQSWQKQRAAVGNTQECIGHCLAGTPGRQENSGMAELRQVTFGRVQKTSG